MLFEPQDNHPGRSLPYLCSVTDKMIKKMEKISGTDNSLVLHFPTGDIECLGGSAPAWREIVDNGNIHIEGNGNRVNLYFGSEEEAVRLLHNIAFNILIIGDGNEMNVGKSLTVCHNGGRGMFGMHLAIGTAFDPWTGTPRTANNCRMDIGEHVITCGAVIYLQEDGSHIIIGRDSMIGWGVDIWCTDAHTIMDMEGNPTNHPHFIEIGEHVWVGKDVKIGKNVRIGSDNIIGWGSIVTKRFESSNQLLVGSTAKVVKTGVRWDGRTIKEYMKGSGR